MQSALEPVPFYASLLESHGLGHRDVLLYGSIVVHAQHGLVPTQGELARFAGIDDNPRNVGMRVRRLIRKGLVRRTIGGGARLSSKRGGETNRYEPLGPGRTHKAA